MSTSVTTSGIAEIEAMFDKLGAESQKVAAHALYEGAKVMADSVTSSAGGIRSEAFRYGTPEHRRYPTPEEAAAAQSATTISKFGNDGMSVSTTVGTSNGGYANINGKSVPASLLARAINSGTSFMVKQPFFRKAVNSARQSATSAIVADAQRIMDEIVRNK